MLPSSFGIASAIIFIWPCEHYHSIFLLASRSRLSGSSIFYFASSPCPSGQFYLLFGPSGNIFFYFAPQPHPSSDTIFYSTQWPHHSAKIFFYLAPRLRLSRQNSPYNPSGLVASGYLQADLAPIPTWFFKASVHWCWCCFYCNAMQQTTLCILSDAHSRLLFIGVGVAFCCNPIDEQSFLSF
jgi:hypothetical protein